ncbi:MAG: hypothetical protein NZL98_00900 [Anaerolineales bacterium]|nr:hypothetical protein [Anaerolineales bacterium]MDW8227968.1 hypothetical protein [Anaerolineales bacterium]
MRRSDHFLLFGLALGILLIVGAFQKAPGYLDADYYYATGLQLAQGRGFSEPFLWNYLDEPAGLPHPSHAYWMPLVSLLAAGVPALFHNASWFLTRVPFFLIAALVSPLTAALAFALHRNRSLALTSGLLAIFSGLYLPFLTTTDAFGVYMVLGGLFFLLLAQGDVSPPRWVFPALGLVVGLMHLARTDGILWLLLALLGVWKFSARQRFSLACRASAVALFLGGYLLVMAPWFGRNLLVFGQILAPGGAKMFWLTAYDQIFAYPSDFLTFEFWIASGWQSILQARWWALGLNLATLFAVQGGVFLLPLAIAGGWELRRDPLVRLAFFSWALLFALMTFIFPFAGARGGYFHAASAFQPILWALTPLGLERLVRWGQSRRGWDGAQASTVLRLGLVFLAVSLTGTALLLRLPTWNDEAHRYRQIAARLVERGAQTGDVVIVSNPPGFYLVSGLAAIAVPDGDSKTLLQLARRYGASYLILEPGSVPKGLVSLYEGSLLPEGIVFLTEVEGAKLYVLQP